jgi:CBS domain-containing protein
MTEASAQKPSVQLHVPVTAGDVMRPALTTVEPNDHMAAAAYLMRHAGATALIVVDDEETKRPMGLVTDTDIVEAVADGKDLNEVRIHDLMTMSPKVIKASTSIPDAARIMLSGRFRHLPVVDDDGGMVGLVDIGDVCGALLTAEEED